MTGKKIICYSMNAEAEGPMTCRKGDFDVKGIKKCRNRETGKKSGLKSWDMGRD